MVLKCRICGGDLPLEINNGIVECDYCGTRQSVPRDNDERCISLFNRANRLRMKGEFDKAAALYESVIAMDPEEAEAYWGLLICKYGIEYVDDPATGTKKPTCHRASYTSVLEDENYKQAMELAQLSSQKLYRAEANEIERIRNEIISLCSEQDPYDIFICYKETDDNGDRTVDSVIAQDIYDTLCDAGYNTFFARITLEDKLGEKYEPYIFSALNSAKVMLAVGTSYEYFHAVWVKNEWSRFLKLAEKDKGKRLIPCYKGIDAYDMPDEFKPLQAQDMSKVGAVQDLLRGISKLIPKKKTETVVVTKVETPDIKTIVKETVIREQRNAELDNLLLRGESMLEGKKDLKKAKEYFGQALDIDVKCAMAYLGLFIAEKNGSVLISDEEIKSYATNGDIVYRNSLGKCVHAYIDQSHGHITVAEVNRIGNYKKAKEYADPVLMEVLQRFEKKLDDTDIMMEAYSADKKFERGNYEAALKLYLDVNAREPMYISYNADKIEKCKLEIKKHNSKIDKYTAVQKYMLGTRMSYSSDPGLLTSGGELAKNYTRYTVPALFGAMSFFDINEIDPIDKIAEYIAVGFDGRVMTSSRNNDVRNAVSEWRDIDKAFLFAKSAVGLKKDGSVTVAGNDQNSEKVGKWSDLKDLVASGEDLIGLKSDGTLVHTMSVMTDKDFVSRVEGLKNVVQISYYSYGVILLAALLDNGNVEYVFYNPTPKKEDTGSFLSMRSDPPKVIHRIKNQHKYIAVSVNRGVLAMVRDDGTLEYERMDHYDNSFCDIDSRKVVSWKGLVAVKVLADGILAVRSDGRALMSYDEENECDIKLFDSIDTIENELKDAALNARQRKIKELKAELAELNQSLDKYNSPMRRMFSKKNIEDIRANIDETENALKYWE